MKRGFVRKISALLVAACVLAALAACSGSPADGCEAPFESGDASSVVTATSEIGTFPEVEFPTPVVTQKTEVSTLVTGEGERLSKGQPALVEVAIFNGANGEGLKRSGFEGEKSGVLLTVGSDALPPVTEALECATVGSRFIVTGTAEETHGGEAIPDAGVAAGDSYVFVVDVLDSFLPKADGTTRASRNGDPTVVLAPNGTPGISVPATEAPEELGVSVLKEGDGAKIEDGDFAVLHYTGVLWDSGEVFDSSWEKNQAAVLQIAEGAVVPGFKDGLVGQKVGSQVLIVIPPALGYGEQASEQVPAGSTLVFVVDVLGIAG